MKTYLYFSRKQADDSLAKSFHDACRLVKADKSITIDDIRAKAPLNYMIGVDKRGSLFQITSISIAKLDNSKTNDLKVVGRSESGGGFGILVNYNGKINYDVANEYGVKERDLASIITKTEECMLKRGKEFYHPKLKGDTPVALRKTGARKATARRSTL